MTLSYQDLMETKRTRIEAEITTDHPASHYSQPVIVLPDGNPLDYQSAILLDYQIEKATDQEREMLAKWQRNMPPIVSLDSLAQAVRGRKGGSVKSERKTEANREKAALPPKLGKGQRGRPGAARYMHTETGSVDTLAGWRKSYAAEELEERGLTAEQALDEDVGKTLVEVRRTRTAAEREEYGEWMAK